MSSKPDYPDKVNGHRLTRRTVPRTDHTRVVYECTRCKSTAEHPTGFRTFGCPGSDPRGAPIVDKQAIREEAGGEDE